MSGVDQIMRLADEWYAHGQTSHSGIDEKYDALRAAVEQMADAVTWVPVLRERAERAEAELQGERTRFLNLEMDVRRLAGWEKPINDFACLNELQAMHEAWAENAANAEAERDALRALLVEAREDWMSSPDPVGPYWVARIDAALKEKP